MVLNEDFSKFPIILNLVFFNIGFFVCFHPRYWLNLSAIYSPTPFTARRPGSNAPDSLRKMEKRTDPGPSSGVYSLGLPGGPGRGRGKVGLERKLQ